MHHDDVVHGEIHSFVRAGNRGIVPFRNLAQEYPCDGILGEIEFCCHARNVVSRYVSAEDRWEMQNPKAVLVLICLELIVVHRAIGGAEIHGAFRVLLDAAAGADGLIVDFKNGVLLMVLVKPFGIHGVRKRCAGAGNRERAIGPQNAADGESYQEQSSNSLHALSPCGIISLFPRVESMSFDCYGIVTTGSLLIESRSNESRQRHFKVLPMKDLDQVRIVRTKKGSPVRSCPFSVPRGGTSRKLPSRNYGR